MDDGTVLVRWVRVPLGILQLLVNGGGLGVLVLPFLVSTVRGGVLEEAIGIFPPSSESVTVFLVGGPHVGVNPRVDPFFPFDLFR
jgi:hypothetical protein